MIEFIERKASSNVRTLGIGGARPQRLHAEAFGGRERERDGVEEALTVTKSPVSRMARSSSRVASWPLVRF